MSEYWIRFLKVSALIVGAYLVLALFELFVSDEGSEERIVREFGFPINDSRSYSIGGEEVGVFSIGDEENEYLVATDRVTGYQSRFTVVVLFSGDRSEPLIVVDGASESVTVDRLLPRRPTAAGGVIDAITGATVTANALRSALQRCRVAIRQFIEDDV